MSGSSFKTTKITASRIITLLALPLILLLAACQGKGGSQAELPKTLRLDWATYNPASLVLKDTGWLEEALAPQGISVEWVQSLGSNKALGFLQGSNIDFGSSAGAASLVSAANGNPVQIVYLYSKPEWTALVTLKDSDIQSIADLKGRKVAATIGTDPYIFLLRALASVGLGESDIELVPLQHGDGATALADGQVEAWAGLDPHMARVELELGARLFYRNPDFNTYGVLNVRSEFAQKYPQLVEKVIQVYDKARVWAKEHPEETAGILAKEAQITPEVALLQISQRTDLDNPYPDAALRSTLEAAGAVLLQGGHLKAGTEVQGVLDTLIQPDFAKRALP